MQKRCEACGMPLAKKEHERAAVLARQELWDFKRLKTLPALTVSFTLILAGSRAGLVTPVLV
jgi:hypothetical protein